MRSARGTIDFQSAHPRTYNNKPSTSRQLLLLTPRPLLRHLKVYFIVKRSEDSQPTLGQGEDHRSRMATCASTFRKIGAR